MGSVRAKLGPSLGKSKLPRQNKRTQGGGGRGSEGGGWVGVGDEIAR